MNDLQDNLNKDPLPGNVYFQIATLIFIDKEHQHTLFATLLTWFGLVCKKLFLIDEI